MMMMMIMMTIMIFTATDPTIAERNHFRFTFVDATIANNTKKSTTNFTTNFSTTNLTNFTTNTSITKMAPPLSTKHQHQ